MASRRKKTRRDIESAFREQGDKNAEGRRDEAPGHARANTPEEDFALLMDAATSFTDGDVAHKEERPEDGPKRGAAFEKQSASEALSAYEDKQPSRKEREETAQLMAAVNAMTPDDAAHGEPRTKDRQPQKRNAVQPVIDRVDLHGLTSDEAIKRLKESLKQWAKRGGMYHVIVGKGSHSPNGVGVLRERVWDWLSRQSGQLPVAEFDWGKPKEGGRGVIVLRVKYPTSGK